MSGANVLVAIFSEQESHAVFLLKQQDVNRIDVVNYIAHGVAKNGEEPGPQSEGSSEVDEDGEKQTSALEAYATNLNEQAKKGLVDPRCF